MAASGGGTRRTLRMQHRRPLAADRCRARLLRRQRAQAGATRPGAGQPAFQQGEVLPGRKIPLDLEPLRRGADAMSTRVRPLQARDKPIWLALFKGYIEFYQA